MHVFTSTRMLGAARPCRHVGNGRKKSTHRVEQADSRCYRVQDGRRDGELEPGGTATAPPRRNASLDSPARTDEAGCARALGEWRATACRAIERGLHIGVSPGMSVRLQKRLWLCNTFAIGGTIIMASWAALEALFGDSGALPWEIGFMAGFLGVLALNARGAHRAARLLLVVTANICVFAGAILFTDARAGRCRSSPWRRSRCCCSARANGCWRRWAPRCPLLLFAVVRERRRRAPARRSIRGPRPAWYFAANAATTFALAFLVPFFLFRSNVRAEAALERSGQEKLKRVIDADLIGVVRGRLSGRIEDANDTFLSLLGYTRAGPGCRGASTSR